LSAGGQPHRAEVILSRRHMAGITPVETERLFLRPWREEDGAELQRLLSDPVVRGGKPEPGPNREVRRSQRTPTNGA
jgi:RimJ/RimL family protein N-acetyltransferase